MIPHLLYYECPTHGRLHANTASLVGAYVFCLRCKQPALLRYKYQPVEPPRIRVPSRGRSR